MLEVTSRNSVKDNNIYSGVLTVEYQEKALRRSLSFKIPADMEAETVDTITVETQD
ncbi:MAG: hypothetical protein RLZZ535_2066 [Cyanobacteriota bacterium]|jgi:hypothetical protein